MARIATYLLASTVTPILDTNLYNVRRDVALPASGGPNSGDYAPLHTIPRAGRIIDADLNTSATLGAGCIVQIALYRAGALVKNLTAPSTAGATSYSNNTLLGPVDALGGDEVVLVVSGANVGSAAIVTTDIQLQH